MLTNRLPDGPQTPPWLQTIQWFANPSGYMEACAQRYGDMFTLRIGPVFTPQVFISNPQAIQEIFSTNPKQLDSGEEAGFQSALLGQQSMLALDGERHRRRRKLLMPPFHGERMRSYGQLICDITEQVTQRWVMDEPFSALSSTQAISFRVILKAVFGLEDGSRYDKIQELLTAALNPKRSLLFALMILFRSLQQDLGSWSPWGKFMDKVRQIDQLIYAEIQERREQPDPSRSDILSLMMAARDESGEPMTDVELRDELLTLLFAGHETTASSLAWGLYWIHSLPHVRKKLLQELEPLGDNPDLSAIVRLPYLNAVCQETLRIYPVAMLGLNRLVKSPLQIMDYQFEPGTILSPCI